MALEELDLPPSDTVRWSPRRKASVVNGVRNGTISLEEACERYQLSAEEFLGWQEAVDAHGIGGLRVTRFQYYRDVPARAGSVRSRAGGRQTGNPVSLSAYRGSPHHGDRLLEALSRVHPRQQFA